MLIPEGAKLMSRDALFRRTPARVEGRHAKRILHGPHQALSTGEPSSSSTIVSHDSSVPLRELSWAKWMRAACDGDSQAYRHFLESVTPYVRAMVRRRSRGVSEDVEDVVQEVLLALHVKRSSWNQSLPIGPWVSVIARNKIVDSYRKRGRHFVVPIEEVADTLAAVGDQDRDPGPDINGLLSELKHTQRDVVQMISIDGTSVRETASHLSMTEGAVYVTLHRALKKLATLAKKAL